MGDASIVSEQSMLDYDADLCGNIEQALKGLQGYDIMALELIQNADDAGASELVFDCRDDALVVRNDASFSSCDALSGRCVWEQSGDPAGRRRPCNFHAIARMGGRSKMGAPDQIGRFGIGFVSVYQITDTPIVRSAGTQLTLNPLIGKGAISVISTVPGTEFELPWASELSDIRAALNDSPTPPHIVSSMVAEIMAVLETSLLFLRHLRRVEVLENGKSRLSVDIDREENHLILNFSPGGSRSWLVLPGDASQVIEIAGLTTKFEALEKLDRSRAVSVAIPVDGSSINGRLFAYLPTEHPTGLPVHVNADFFPHASRQDIVLKGEGHERYWNEALIVAAARIVGENLMTMRDALGPVGLWEFGSAALKLKGEVAFEEFWTAFATAAKSSLSVWTISESWKLPADARLAPQDLVDSELQAVADIGLELLDQKLRPHASALAAVGAGELQLSTVVAALEARQGRDITPDNSGLNNLWSAVGRMVAASANRIGFLAVLARLKAAKFVLDVDGNPASPDDLWRLPPNVRWQDVRYHLDDCPIMSDQVAMVPGITALIDEMGIDELALSISSAIRSDEDATLIIGAEPSDARHFYTLLMAFAARGPARSARTTLSDTPILRTAEGFVQPSRGQLPGNFHDPSGYFELVDTEIFPPGMDEFARNILEVDVLSFHQYVDRHLPTILQRGVNQHQYREIVAQIAKRKNELEDRGSLDSLRDLAFVRTRAGTFARPRDCYCWAADLETILGTSPSIWVEASWMPSSLGPQVQDLFNGHLGMPTTVAARHIVDRIEALAADGTPSEVAESVTPIIRHVMEHWTRFDEDDLDTLKELKDVPFLPAIVGGARDEEELYLPGDVYRAARARGFESQVAVIDLTPLRLASAKAGALLDLLEVPDEPATTVVVDHLRQCMADEVAPSNLTYAILNERVDDDDDVAAIGSLKDARCIYDPMLKRFLVAEQVFWLPPPFKDYWWQASGKMGQLSHLYELLGVRDEPSVGHYVTLMCEIAGKSDTTVRDLETHAHCVAYLCDAMEIESEGLEDALEALRSNGSLLTVDGDAIWPEDAIWLDSKELAEPFGTALNDSLVLPPDAAKSSAARFYQRLGVRPLSGIARLRLAAEPDRREAGDVTSLLRNRADLLLWVAPNAASRKALRMLLGHIEIQLTDRLVIQAEIASFDPPVTSPLSRAPAFYEYEVGTLHIEGRDMRNPWPAAFRAIFAEIEHLALLADIKPLIMTATLIMRSDSWESAEETLLESGYRAPTQDVEPTESGGSLGEEWDEVAEEEEEYADEGGKIADEFDEVTDDPSSTDKDERGDSYDADPADDDECENPVRRSAGAPSGSEEWAGDTYKSKAGTGGIGGQDDTGSPNSSGGQAHQTDTAGGKGSAGPLSKGSASNNDGGRDRSARTSRMRSYVGREGDRIGDDNHSEIGEDIGALIDIAAITAVVKYEEQRGWTPMVQPHNNPGYDIISSGPEGERRLIEVKGLENDWTERGVKMSHVQFSMAQEHSGEYWIYVVERARDLAQQRVSAIANPFQKVEEYWFDSAWRALADEGVSARSLNLTVGAQVRHRMWGIGRIVDVQKGGIRTELKIDFGFEGIKLVPFNSSIELIS